ncbi:hypothetical protein C1Y63_02380 [Corynebacterium sp. 13CS0277]|uniref:HNH endonuclease signature motif containing protein n=1 Tax=Corynebacterium sp. 13CS0277 TaxID=2071994 RepID=UPI000D025764|nr:HNH endonuclease signature motif containing protein [Corynebacterium sp. 13CS0277]PRQ12178.1 hypothetical protein C1Y63_02380 [Corynebacterium sp. 13CS0277]
MTTPLAPAAIGEMLRTALGGVVDLARSGDHAGVLEVFSDCGPMIAHLNYGLASFAHAAVATGAGDTVGSTNARDFVTSQLGISNREGNVLIKRGQVFHNPVDPAEQQWHEQSVDLFLEGKVGLEKFDAVNNALKKVPAGSDIKVEKVRCEAFQQAAQRPVEDLRAWVTSTIAVETTTLSDAEKERQARKLRAFRFGPQDHLGGCSFTGYLPGAEAAVVKQCLAKSADTLAAFDREASEKKNTKISRSTDQYYADALAQMAARALKQWDARHDDSLRGTASLVISVVADEIAAGNPGGYATSNGMWLSNEQVCRLLGDNYDWLAVHDSYTGFPLALGRTARSASIPQRIALFAAEGTCAYPGCNRSIDLAQAHHIKAWRYQGRTDLKNLALMCTYHHGFNDDHGGSDTRGRVERCPDTLETYWEFRGTRTPNRSVGRSRAPGNKIRKTYHPPPPNDTPLGLSGPPGDPPEE